MSDVIFIDTYTTFQTKSRLLCVLNIIYKQKIQFILRVARQQSTNKQHNYTAYIKQGQRGTLMCDRRFVYHVEFDIRQSSREQ